MSQEKTVASNIATKRVLDLFESTGMAIDPFEKAVGLTEGTIKNLKNHKYNASADTICRIAEYFEVTTDYIMGYTDFPKSPTSWYVFRRIATRLNKSWDTITKELNKPLSFFVDWEHGQEPNPIELWAICNTWQLKTNPFEKTKKTAIALRPNTLSFSDDELKILMENKEGTKYFEQIIAKLNMQQKVFVISWLVGYAQSQGISVEF